MRTRVKIFTFPLATGATVIDTALEDQVNQWLKSVDGDLISVTQSESFRYNGGQHLTVCIWYVPRHEHGDTV